jgi:hypothetical protein
VEREQLTIKRSRTGGRNWSTSLLVQAGRSAGYSSLVKGAVHDDAHGGVLFELAAGKVVGSIAFALFPLEFYGTDGTNRPFKADDDAVPQHSAPTWVVAACNASDIKQPWLVVPSKAGGSYIVSADNNTGPWQCGRDPTLPLDSQAPGAPVNLYACDSLLVLAQHFAFEPVTAS